MARQFRHDLCDIGPVVRVPRRYRTRNAWPCATLKVRGIDASGSRRPSREQRLRWHRYPKPRTVAHASPSKDPGDRQALSNSFSTARASSGRSAGLSERHRVQSACIARSTVDDVDGVEALNARSAPRRAAFRPLAEEYFVEHDTQRPDVGTRGRRIPSRLGRHVVRRADEDADHRAVGKMSREPEVGQHEASVVRAKHVVGFDVAVNDAGSWIAARPAITPAASARRSASGRSAGSS